jgi:hypothetical protein
MEYVYSKGGEFCSSTFTGSAEIALASGYKEVSDEMYAKLLTRDAHWVDEELVDRVKPQEEKDAEAEAARIAAIDAEIAELKAELAGTDYKAIKYAEGWITAEEYEETKAQRQAWRDRINELEAEKVASCSE